MTTQSSLPALIDQTVRLYHRLKAVASEIHAGDGITAGERGVLRGLVELGPQTVPHMARIRPVSRQHIQSLVNPLIEKGYVELLDNPHHKRSKLVGLTDRGRALLERMHAREAETFAGLASELSEADLVTAVAVLEKTRLFFEKGVGASER